MTTTQLFWQFFKPVAESVPGITTVSRSGGDKMDRLLANSTDEDIYPAAFLLRPKYSIEDNGAGATIAWFDSTYYVICTGRMDDDDQEDAAFDEAERLATELTSKLFSHVDDYTVLIDPTSRIFMEPVTMVTLEASYGYEVRFRIGLQANSSFYAHL
ncbi:hypothetical protein GCM10028807_17480 [Spirosoma daeguense]